MKSKKDGSTYGRPCPSCGKVIDYRSSLCWTCTWAATPKKRCLDCEAIIRPAQERCWPCHKRQVAAEIRRCLDCGGELPTNGGKSRCRACHIASLEAKVWRCVDCNTEVGRRVKRCPVCAAIARKATTGRYERTAETKAKMSLATKGKPKPHLRGKTHRPETKAKMKAYWTEERREAASRNWKGPTNPAFVHGMKARAWPRAFSSKLRAAIRRRDADTCQICGVAYPHRSRGLAVHHIDYDKANNDPVNLITTCLSCHAKTNFRRRHWESLLVRLQARRARSGFLPTTSHPASATT